MNKKFDYENQPIVDIVNEIIVEAIKKNASDIHFDPTEDGLRIRMRIDGILIDYSKAPLTVQKNMITRIKILAGMNITESRLPQDGAIKNELEGYELDLRVSSLPIVHGEKIVIRILDYSMSLKGLDKIDFTKDNLKKVKDMIATPNGIILVTGATGSGKSTTVYSILQKLNSPETNIITVEDPVEMEIKGINQVQVMSEIGMTFGAALRSILRQDPNIIMIGEIRDDETARIAVRASITGHLVLSTIHTNNSLSTIERLLDMEVERYLLGSALEGIISQRLARRLCPHCKKEQEATEYERNVIKKAINKDIKTLYVPVGCDKCINGYKGRIAIHEILKINQDIRDAITSNISKKEFRLLVYNKKNVTTLLQDGLYKVVEGHTSFEEILKLIDINEDYIGEETDDLKATLMGKDVPNEEKKETEDKPKKKKDKEEKIIEKEQEEESKEEEQKNEEQKKEENKKEDIEVLEL